MARFWFTSAPLPGHADWGGLLKTAQALIAHGHDVVWVSEDRLRGLITRAGVPFEAIDESGWLWPPPPLPCPVSFVNENIHTLRYRRALDTWLSVDRVRSAVEALRDLAGRIPLPDVIVTDPFLSAGALAAELIGVPLAVGGWPAGPALDEDRLLYVQRQLGQEGRDRVAQLCAQFGLDGVNFSDGPTPEVQSPRLHISYFNAYWYQGEPFLSQTVFVGGEAPPPQDDPPDWLAAIPGEVPLGLVTLGSTFTNDLDFFVHGAHALAQSDLLPLVVIGWRPLADEVKQTLVHRLPGGTRLLNWVPYDHVFPRLSVVLHHGGMGTTHAAILHAIPQVISPRAAEQRGQARRARQAKVGLEITPKEVASGQLIPAVKAIISTPLVQNATQHLQAGFADLGGPTRAADLLIDLAGGER
jgi:UDP:flavonoid glycosyltransferase YjiC (YdhE family)